MHLRGECPLLTRIVVRCRIRVREANPKLDGSNGRPAEVPK
jgi:hypothetical protein